MRFIKDLVFDFRQGILRSGTLLLVPAVIAAVTFFDFYAKARRYLEQGMIQSTVDYGDYWFYLYGGMCEYIPSPDNPFQFPAVWILIFLVLPFIILNYPFRDMYGVGQQILVRSGRRSLWWLSKCCWNFCGTVLYHLIIQAAGLVLSLAFGVEISNRIHMDFINLVFNIRYQEVWNPSSLPVAALLLPVLVSAAINMLQMTVSLFIRPMFGFFSVAVLLLASAYLLSPLLIGNYAMAFRYDWVLKAGVSMEAGMRIAVILLLLAALTGLVRFWLYDILESE